MLASSSRFYFPEPPAPRNVSRDKRELWDELNAFVQQRGAALSSVRSAWPARLECSSDDRVLLELELATVITNGRRYGFAVRRCTEQETGGPVLRIKPVGKVEQIARLSSEHGAYRVATHAAEIEVASYNITTRSA